MNREVEEAFITAFIAREKRERCLRLVGSPKGRKKFLGLLYHQLPIDPSRATWIANGDGGPAKIAHLLIDKGAPKMCYIISPEGDLDGRTAPLWAAVEDVLSNDRVAIVCCIPGRLAYYKAELEACLLELQIPKYPHA